MLLLNKTIYIIFLIEKIQIILKSLYNYPYIIPMIIYKIF